MKKKSVKKIFFEKKWTILLVLLVVFVTTIGFVFVTMFQNKLKKKMENIAVASSSNIDELEEFDQREIICNICNDIMCFSYYWSKSHICYLKLISYKYVTDLPKAKSRFIKPQHISKTVNTHYCNICSGFFPINQYKNGTIWYHQKCTPTNISFFKNIKSVNIEKHNGN